jgi:hypothetical protein
MPAAVRFAMTYMANGKQYRRRGLAEELRREYLAYTLPR